MSVTFNLHPLPEPTGWSLTCDVYGSEEVTVGDYTDAGLYNITHTAGCADCRDQGGMLLLPLRDPEGLNVNQAGAQVLLDALGYTTDGVVGLTGVTGAEDFLGRCLTALGLAPVDAGVPAAADPGKPRWADGGRRPGYVQDRLRQLAALAEVARERGCEISWA